MTAVGRSPYPVTNQRTSLAWRFAARAAQTSQEIIDRVAADAALAEHFTAEVADVVRPAIRESVIVNSEVLKDGRTPAPAGTPQIVAAAVEQHASLDLLQRAYRIGYAVQLEVCVELVAQMPMQERDRRPLMREALDLLLRAELERTRVVGETFAAVSREQPED